MTIESVAGTLETFFDGKPRTLVGAPGKSANQEHG